MSHELTELKRRFRDVVAAEVELRAIVGQPQQRALDKEISVIDDVSRRFIAHAPFVFVASSGEESPPSLSRTRG